MASFLEDSSKTMMEIRDDLICEVCEGHARPGKSQWYRCSKLHLICLDCKTSNKNCSCGKPMSEEHCKIIEKLLSVKGLKFNCVNTKHGCRKVLLESALEDHEPECTYRLVPDPFFKVVNGVIKRASTDCTAFKNMLYEYRNTQTIRCPNQYKRLEKVKLSSNEDTSPYFTQGAYGIEVEYDGKTFICECICFSGTVYFWVYCFGSPNEAKYYSVTLEFFGAKTSTVFKGQVVPVGEFFDDFVNAGKSFSINQESFMAQFVNENRQFEYSLEIKNLKKEIKDENYESGISDNDE